MKLTAVSSSNVVAVGYDAGGQRLLVQFKSGCYAYAGVPRHVFDGIFKAPSIGQYINQVVKPHYTFEKLPAGHFTETLTVQVAETVTVQESGALRS